MILRLSSDVRFRKAACGLERVCKTKGWVSLDDAKSILIEFGSVCHPHTLLSRFYQCTGQPKALRGTQKRWVANRYKRASNLFRSEWLEGQGA